MKATGSRQQAAANYQPEIPSLPSGNVDFETGDWLTDVEEDPAALGAFCSKAPPFSEAVGPGHGGDSSPPVAAGLADRQVVKRSLEIFKRQQAAGSSNSRRKSTRPGPTTYASVRLAQRGPGGRVMEK